MTGFSPRNLQSMRTFAGAYPDPERAQQLLRDVPPGHIAHLLDRVDAPEARAWYAAKAVELCGQGRRAGLEPADAAPPDRGTAAWSWVLASPSSAANITWRWAARTSTSTCSSTT